MVKLYTIQRNLALLALLTHSAWHMYRKLMDYLFTLNDQLRRTRYITLLSMHAKVNPLVHARLEINVLSAPISTID